MVGLPHDERFSGVRIKWSARGQIEILTDELFRMFTSRSN